MVYYFFQWLEETYGTSGAQIWQFLSFRAGVTIVFSLIISLLLGGKIIKFLHKQQVGESIRDLGLEGQKQKEGTPTMGGIIIILAILIPTILFADLSNSYIILMIISTMWMASIGFVDDYIKVFRKNKKGLKGRFKILGQIGLGLILSIFMLQSDSIVVRTNEQNAINKNLKIVETINNTNENGIAEVNVKSSVTNVPFLKSQRLDYTKVANLFGINGYYAVWIIFLPLVTFIITAVSNGANLTDGMDGLATGISAIIGATLGLLTYLSGNLILSDYLGIIFLPGAGELVVYIASLMGACLGFLWYNAYPAQVFMGDTGSLTLGGIIASLAILIRMELLLPVLCGIFFVENMSVILQVGYFKYTRKKYGKGRRIFKMAPLHHHYQKMLISEPKIVTRFWLVGILLAVLTILTLKVR